MSPSATGQIPGWFARFGWRRAARRYARRLPGYLSRSYGGSKTYTTGQLAAAVRHLRLDQRHVALAFAAYLDQPEYDGQRAARAVWPDHAWARGLFMDALPSVDPDPGPYYTGPDTTAYL